MGTWPLCARQGELTEALRCFDVPGAGAALTGPTGVGKSRLATEVAARLTESGRVLVPVVASPASSRIPFGAFAPYIDDLTAISGVDVLRHLMRRFGDGKTVIAVDDAQHLDFGSAALVYQLAVSARAQLLVTVRTDEAMPEEVRRLWRDAHLTRIEIAPFGPEDVRALLDGVLDGGIDVLTAERMHTWTGGNALYLHELVAEGLRTGRLARQGSQWRWSGESAVSGGLLEIIDARLGELSSAARKAMAALSLAAPATAHVLDVVVGPDSVHELRNRGLCTANAGLVRPTHPVFAEHALTIVSPSARNELRRALAKEWAQSPGADNPTTRLRIVTALVDAGEPPSARELVLAAEQALGLLEPRLAERLARSAGPDPAAAVVHARALAQQGKVNEADQLLRDTNRSGQESRTITAHARILLDAWRPQDALTLLDTTPEKTFDVTACRVLAYVLLTRHADAVALYDADLRPHLRGQGVESITTATMAVCTALSEQGQPGAALERTEVALRAIPHEQPERLWVQLMETESLASLGRFDEAQRGAEAMRHWGIASQWPVATGCGLAYLGIVAAARGSYRQAVALMRDAVATTYEHNAFELRGRRLALLATYQAAAGDTVAATASIGDALARRSEHEVFGELHLVAEAFVLACSGAVSEARAKLRELTDRTATEHLPGRGIGALHLLARLGMAKEAERRLEAHAGAESPVWAAHAAHIRTLATRDPEQLLAVSEQYERMQMWHYAAEAADVAGDLLAESGQATRHVAAARVKRDTLLARCDTQPFPWWPMTNRPRLSTRELEIATLAAAGLTNREIATRLVLSVRTVENHLARSFHKLGVTSRNELAEALSAER